jgi:hypothetical protein
MVTGLWPVTGQSPVTTETNPTSQPSGATPVDFSCTTTQAHGAIRNPAAVAIIVICTIISAVGIAQLVEHRTVAPTVAGSIPVSHPNASSDR